MGDCNKAAGFCPVWEFKLCGTNPLARSSDAADRRAGPADFNKSQEIS